MLLAVLFDEGLAVLLLDVSLGGAKVVSEEVKNVLFIENKGVYLIGFILEGRVGDRLPLCRLDLGVLEFRLSQDGLQQRQDY